MWRLIKTITIVFATTCLNSFICWRRVKFDTSWLIFFAHANSFQYKDSLLAGSQLPVQTHLNQSHY